MPNLNKDTLYLLELWVYGFAGLRFFTALKGRMLGNAGSIHSRLNSSLEAVTSDFLGFLFWIL